MIKNTLAPIVLAVALLASAETQLPAQGTAFTYQGRLNFNGSPAAGNFDFRFRLATDAFGNNYVGSAFLTNAAPVTNGLFLTTLDFGSGIFTGGNLWLQIEVKTNGAAGFTTLFPLQNFTPTPYAMFANTASNVSGTVSATQISGAVASANLSGTYGGLLALSNAGNAFSGGGANLTGLNAAQLATGTVPDARLSGNVPLLNGNQTFSGVNNLNNPANNFNGTFHGDGAGVTNINLVQNSGGLISLSGNFVLTASPGAGNNPERVVAADVNGDGKVDLISANTGSSTLTVLTNNGTGNFGFNATLNVGSFPLSLVTADVNGDGKPDLISANYNPSTLTVLTNNGTGGFVLASSPTVGLNPDCVVAADVNGDGKVDLISANPGSSTLTVLTNSGAGSFGSNATLTVGLNPNSVVAADVNGDGKVDLISANYTASTLTVLTNNGSGGFGFNAALTVGINPASVLAADINSDGKVDLITVNTSDGSLTVLTNNGSGGFVLASTVSSAGFAQSVMAADVNGDGKLDLISADTGANTLILFTNNGNSSFAPAATLAVGRGPEMALAVDVNGDGKPDLISVNYFGHNLSVLINAPFFGGAINASQLAGGTVPDARLSTNVALLNADQKFTGVNTFGSTTYFSSGISAPMWNVITMDNIPGALPKTNSLNSYGGTLVISASGSGYSTIASASIGMDIKLDGALINSCTVFANPALTHLAFVPKTFKKSGVAAGTHMLTLSARNGTSTDSTDNFCVTIQELPF